MIIGYARRTSTLDQTAGLEAQLAALGSITCDKVFTEQVSSVNIRERQQLALALDYLRAGDVLAVTKLDRLARSVAHLCELLEIIESKGASLRILDMGVDTATPTGRLLLTLMGGIAEFEREIMLERQREGIAKAKAEGRYKGRKATAMARADEVHQLVSQGVPKGEIGGRLGISRASVYRVLGASGKAWGFCDSKLPASSATIFDVGCGGGFP